MHRKMVWVKMRDFGGWGCSECSWVFNPSGAPIGNSLEEMKENFLKRLDKDYAAHVCAAHPKAKGSDG